MKNKTKAKALKKDPLVPLRNGDPITGAQSVLMILKLSIPAILAHISGIIMQYIDASMVGKLGADQSASIGLVSSSTWLLNGICIASSVGFTVQIANKIGAKDEKSARNTAKLGIVFTTLLGVFVALLGISIGFYLPEWLGGDESIRDNASAYFIICTTAMPLTMINHTCAGMLQCSGNMKIPGILDITMCVLDVIFNFFLIFPTRNITVFSHNIIVPGAGMGVAGAALGTSLAFSVTGLIMLYFLMFRSDSLKFRKGERLKFNSTVIKNALKISVPVAIEEILTCGAHIAFTKIVAPLGNAAIAANSFSITAESLCYMPGFGVATAATTIIGQSLGAKRYDMAKRLSRLTLAFGMLLMTVTGVLMYIFAPQMLALITPDPQIIELGTGALRIEAFAEPMFAAAIVCSGIFRGAGDTAITGIIAFISMWLIRIPLAVMLVGDAGLSGAWLAMCIEICARGALFIVLLFTRFKRRTEKQLYKVF
ncbi:MAG: MATE family efflux transporter [Clostridiales bacterium]|nr:MATE family efflux transporter [Clostridiales bacterium]